MGKTGVIYYSKTGFTRKYAEWLAEALECDAVAYPQAAKTTWSDYDTVIFASWFHAGRIQKLDWFMRLPLAGKKRIVAAVGAMPADAPEVPAALRSNFGDGWAQYHVFYLPGGLCYEKMGAADRALNGGIPPEGAEKGGCGQSHLSTPSRSPTTSPPARRASR